MSTSFADIPEPRAYQPLELSARHDEILRMKLTGLRHGDIAAALGITTAAVGYVVNSEMGKRRLQELSELADLESCDVALEIRKSAPKAIRLLKEVIDGTVEGAPIVTRVRAAQDMLDRAGHGKVERKKIEFTGYMGGLEELKQRAREAGVLADSIDADFAEVACVDGAQGNAPAGARGTEPATDGMGEAMDDADL